MLTLARMDADRGIVQWDSIRSESLLEQVITLTAPLAIDKGLALLVHPPAQPFVVTTNPGKAVQILVNLVGNAVRFTDRGEITLTRTTRPGSWSATPAWGSSRQTWDTF